MDKAIETVHELAKTYQNCYMKMEVFDTFKEINGSEESV